MKRSVPLALAAGAALSALALYAARVYTDQHAAEARQRHEASLRLVDALVDTSRAAVQQPGSGRLPAAESNVIGRRSDTRRGARSGSPE